MAQESIGTARLDIVVDTSQFDAAIASAKRGTSDMSQSAQADYTKLAAAERRRVDSLVNQANTIGMTRKEQILYNAALRGVPTSILDELKTKLSATGAAAAGATKQMNQYGVSAAQQAAALRGVPAQLTDIVVSLQGGQQPLTVLLQQGGQLKDMFGGIVPAARALGSTILGLVGPWTLAAGAVALFTAAVVSGKGEQSEFTKTLILTGNAAGQTAQGLVDMSRRVGEAHSTVGRSADVLNKLVASGRVTGSSLETVAGAIVNMSETGARSVDDLVAEFGRLGESPSEAIAKINESMKFLDAATYDRIRTLEAQGQKEQAVALAQSTLADATNRAADRVRASAGTLERGWNSLGLAARQAWDAMLNIGRPTPIAELRKQAEELTKTVESLENNQGFTTTEGGAATGGGRNRAQQALKLKKQELATITAEIQRQEKEQADARAQGLKGQLTQEKIAADARLDEIIKAGRARSQIQQDELKKLDADAQKYGWAADKVEAARAAIIEKYKDPKGAGGAFKDDAAAKLLQQYREAEASLQAQITSEGKLATWGQKRAEFEQQIADLKDKKVLTADQKSLLAQEDLLRHQLDLNVAAEKELRTKQETAKVEALRVSLASTRDLEQQQYADQVAGVGLGDRAQEELRARQGILRDYQRQQAQFDRSMASGQMLPETYQSQSALLKEHLDLRLSMQQQYFDQVREAQGNWKNGATSALGNYLESTANVAVQTKTLFSNAFQGMEDAIVRFATTGKLSFKDFATSIIADMTRIAARQAAAGVLNGIFGTVAGAAVSGISAGAGYQGSGMAAVGSTDGMAGSWGAVAGARASGGPTAANSLYRVNELGPELYSEGGETYLMSGANGGYVTPLRSSVAAGGGSGGANYQITNQVIFNDGGRESRESDQDDALGREMLRQMEVVAQRVVDRSHRQGGAAWNARNGRA
ncbi:phage tail tape measure protein [Achromobacter sp. UBA2119]|uniref:phage tail tape measure protein n=1 Tax=Achromobacter sp. UBA2119 TaxID=1945911 RepID=UPI00257DAA2B|nr:phage tail tape measure protein [Achromobacter sp. UBA2119]